MSNEYELDLKNSELYTEISLFLERAKELDSMLKSVRFVLDSFIPEVRPLCVNCLDARKRARDHAVRYRAEKLNSKES